MNAHAALLIVIHRPSWLRDSAYTDNALQDAVQEIIDPDNERGDLVIAHYAVTQQPVDDADPRRDERYADWLDLLGVEVRGAHATVFLSRFDLDRAGLDCLSADRRADE